MKFLPGGFARNLATQELPRFAAAASGYASPFMLKRVTPQRSAPVVVAAAVVDALNETGPVEAWRASTMFAPLVVTTSGLPERSTCPTASPRPEDPRIGWIGAPN